VRAIAPWIKRNAMPESVRDRPGVAHEDVFILTKNERCFWDQDAVKVPQTGNAHARGRGVTPKGAGAARSIDRGNNSFQSHTASQVVMAGGRNRRTSDWYLESLDRMIADAHDHLRELCRLRDEGGVLADETGLPLVFDIKTKGYKGAHYATFPAGLVEPMIEAATSAYGCCPTCGAPWTRVVIKPDFSCQPKRGAGKLNGRQRTHNDGYLTGAGGTWQAWRSANPDLHAGWEPTCDCPLRAPIPCLVLDPFGGTGTVGIAAATLGRRAAIVDLSGAYLAQARGRILDELFDVSAGDLEAGAAGLQLAIWDLEPEYKEQT
jgi:hypothetical protein